MIFYFYKKYSHTRIKNKLFPVPFVLVRQKSANYSSWAVHLSAVENYGCTASFQVQTWTSMNINRVGGGESTHSQLHLTFIRFLLSSHIMLAVVFISVVSNNANMSWGLISVSCAWQNMLQQLARLIFIKMFLF